MTRDVEVRIFTITGTRVENTASRSTRRWIEAALADIEVDGE
jgi:hypothetical protein